MTKDWQKRLITPEEAVKVIKSGNRIFIGSACATPQSLVRALVQVPAEDLEILHILTLGVAPYVQEKFAERFRANAFFISANVRKAVWEERLIILLYFCMRYLSFLKPKEFQ